MITSKEALEFIKTKADELRKSVPGYSQVSIEVSGSQDDGMIRSARFRAYNEHCNHSPDFEDADEAIAWVRQRIQHRRQSDMVRAKAAELILKAQELEAAGK